MRALWLLFLLCACPPPPERKVDPLRPPAPVVRNDVAQREAVTRFLDAADRGAFEEVYALLSEPLRARYDAARLRADFGREPLVKARLERVRTALALEFLVKGDVATLPLGGTLEFRLVREHGQWHVAQLE